MTKRTIAEIGYTSPSGATRFYSYCGAPCSGAGYVGPMYPAPWLDVNFEYAPVYSVSYSFNSLTEFKKHFENI